MTHILGANIMMQIGNSLFMAQITEASAV